MEILRINVPLRSDVAPVLIQSAQTDYRDPRDQAAYLIMEALYARGLLGAKAQAAITQPPTLETKNKSKGGQHARPS